MASSSGCWPIFDQDATCREVNLGPGVVVLDGVAGKNGHSLHFSVHAYCNQTAGWMKTPLGTEVDLGPGHIVLDVVPAPAKGFTAAPYFRPMSIVATVAHLNPTSS